MSLESLVRQLNAEFATATWRSTQRQPLLVEQGRVIVHFRGLCLRSTFARVVDLSGGLLGYQAQLRVTDRRRRPLPLWVPYAMACLEDQAVISLDRLCRTLHALNGLAHAASGWLLLDVHPRHVQKVRQDHGRVFENLYGAAAHNPDRLYCGSRWPERWIFPILAVRWNAFVPAALRLPWFILVTPRRTSSSCCWT